MEFMESIGKTLAGKAVLTAQDLNEQNRRFWRIQSELLDKRMSDELLYTIATMDVCSETLRQVPIYSQKSLEQALADAEKIKSACQTAFSRKGGSTPRCDALQGLIEEIVREKMKITQGQLLGELKGARGAGTVIPETKRLIVNLPPRSLKSHAATVAFPAWLLGHNPAIQIICASYGQELADKHARDCRTLIMSEFYQKLFPRTRLSSEKKSVNEFLTTGEGFRMSTSVGGVLTGRGADIIILDDPLKLAKQGPLG
jgi:hypothetical protein